MKHLVIGLIILFSIFNLYLAEFQLDRLDDGAKVDVSGISQIIRRGEQQNSYRPTDSQPQYNIVKEDCDRPPSRMCNALLITSKEWFSEEYYSVIFNNYSKRFPNKEDSLSAYLYIDEDYNKNKQFINGLHFGSLPSRKSFMSNPPKSVAYYRNNSDHITSNEVTEYYSYQNQDPPLDRITIVRGSLLSRSREAVDSFESILGELKVRIVSYKLPGVTPSETYYTVECYSKDLQRWRGVVSVQFDQRIPLPKEQIVFLSDDIAFVFIGWKYVITTDRGKTWHKWDGESELPDWKCCASDLIQKVTMSPGGNGTMTLKLKPNSSLEVMRLRTQNYGKSWKAG